MFVPLTAAIRAKDGDRMKRIAIPVAVAVSAAFFGLSLPTWAQTATQSGGKPKNRPSHIVPMHPNTLTLYPHGRPKPRHSTYKFHPSPLRPADSHPQHLHGLAVLLSCGPLRERALTRPRLRCELCGQAGRYRLEGLMARFPPYRLPDVLIELGGLRAAAGTSPGDCARGHGLAEAVESTR